MKKQILVFSAFILLATFFMACEQEAVVNNPADDITQLNADSEAAELSEEEVEEFMELLQNETTEDEIESRCYFPVAIGIVGPDVLGAFPIPCISRYRFQLSAAGHNTRQDYYIAIQQNRSGAPPIFDVVSFPNATSANFTSRYYYRDTGNSSNNECEIKVRIYVRNRDCNTITKILDTQLPLH